MLSLTFSMLSLLACKTELPREELAAREELELAAREELEATTIRVEGVMSPPGTVRISATAGSDGSFWVELPRRNDWLVAQADGYRDEARGLHLMRPLSVTTVTVDLTLEPDVGAVRWIFAGDTAVGRRYLDPDESTPRDQVPKGQDDALVRSEHAYDDTSKLLASVAPLIDRADRFVVNLETPVLDDPATPHSKEYVFFTLPPSAEAIRDAGVDYVSLGNNHQCDYLDQGIVDTLDWLATMELPHSGLGVTPEQAWTPAVLDAGGERWAMISATTVLGAQYDRGFIATDEEGGAANGADDEELIRAIKDALFSGQRAIVQMHMGTEYTEVPSKYGRGRADLASQEGAALFIGHHPHVVQGLGWHEGMLAVWSLGNFAFDQDRLETMLGATLEVDLLGDQVQAARMWPLYIEDYVPRIAVGELAERFLRRVAGDSTATVQVSDGRLQVLLEDREPTLRSVDHTVTLNGEGWAVVDLRQLAESYESLAYAKSSAGTARLGRDLIQHGGFEDLDIDDQDYEVARWNHADGDSRFPCVMNPFRGAMAMCSTREAWDGEPSVVTFRQRIRMLGFEYATPNNDVSVLGYVFGDNAGPLKVQIEHLAGEKDKSFGEHFVWEHDGGDLDWTPFAADITMPAGDGTDDAETNPWAVQLRLFHYPMDRRDGMAIWDDLAVVNWVTEALELAEGFDVDTPHGADFLRVEGAANSTLELGLAFED